MLIFLSICLVWSCSGRLLTPEDPSAGTGRLWLGLGLEPSSPTGLPASSRSGHEAQSSHRHLGAQTQNAQCCPSWNEERSMQHSARELQLCSNANPKFRVGPFHGEGGEPCRISCPRWAVRSGGQTGPWGEGHAPGRCFCRKTAHGHVPLVCALPDNGTNVRPDPKLGARIY